MSLELILGSSTVDNLSDYNSWQLKTTSRRQILGKLMEFHVQL